jgi:uncharacterized RDD family membrane protein YckC
MIVLLLAAEVATGALVLLVGSRLFGVAWQGRFVPWLLAALIAALFVTYWGYYIVGEVFRGGRTFGKRIASIRVIRDDGSRPAVLDSVIRNVVRVVDLMPATYAVGIASVLLHPQGKRLGDIAAGTVVVVETPPLALTSLGPAEERAALVDAYLRRRTTMTPAARMQVVTGLLALFGAVPEQPWDQQREEERLVELIAG